MWNKLKFSPWNKIKFSPCKNSVLDLWSNRQQTPWQHVIYHGIFTGLSSEINQIFLCSSRVFLVGLQSIQYIPECCNLSNIYLNAAIYAIFTWIRMLQSIQYLSECCNLSNIYLNAVIYPIFIWMLQSIQYLPECCNLSNIYLNFNIYNCIRLDYEAKFFSFVLLC